MDHQGLIKLGARKTPLAEAKGVSESVWNAADQVLVPACQARSLVHEQEVVQVVLGHPPF